MAGAIRYYAKKEYRAINQYVQNNDLEVVTVDGRYVSFMGGKFTDDLEEAIILHPEYSYMLAYDMKQTYHKAEIFTWRYVDLLKNNFKDNRHMKIKGLKKKKLVKTEK